MEKFNFKLTENLKEKLNLISRIAQGNGANSPYPAAIKVDEKGYLHAANSLNSISYKFGVDEVGITPSFFSNAVLLPLSAVKLLLSSPTDVDVIIEDDIGRIRIRCGKKKSMASFNKMPIESFPEIKTFKKDSVQKIPSDFFVQGIESTRFAASKGNTAKPILSCINFIAEDIGIVAYAIDGYKAAIARCDCVPSKPFSISLPEQTINILTACKFDDDVLIGLSESKTSAFILLDNQTLIRTCLIGGTIVNYKTFFVKKDNNIIVNKQEILNILKAISLIHSGKDTQVIKMRISENEMELLFKGENSEYSDSVSISENEVSDKEEKSIGINYTFLESAVKACPGDKVKISYNGPLEPIILSSENISTVVVPVKLANT